MGEGFDTFYGVKQGDPLSTDLFGIMIEILDEYLNLIYPDMGVKIIIIIIIKGHSLRRACLQPATNTQNSKPRPPTTNDMGVKIGSKYISGKYYIDYLSRMIGKVEDFQKALDIIEQLCFSFGFKVNINKTEVFGPRRASTPDVKGIKEYVGLNFTGNRNCSPSVEHLIVAAERTRFAVVEHLLPKP